MTAITLTIPGRPFSQNDQRRMSHWTTVRRAKSAVETAVYAAVVEQHGHHAQLRRKAAALVFPVTVTIADHCRTTNLRDTEACAPTVKVALDVLTDIGVFSRRLTAVRRPHPLPRPGQDRGRSARHHHHRQPGDTMTPSTELVLRPTTSALTISEHEQRRLQGEINLILRSSLVPDAVRGKPEEMLTIALYGRALGLPLIASLQHIVVIKGRPFVETKALGAVLNERGIQWMFEETSATTCTVMGRHPNDPKDWPLRRLTFTMAEAQAGGLTSNECYRKHPADMLRHRTLGKWVRANVPEVMMGMQSAGIFLAESDLDQPIPQTFDPDEVVDGELEPPATQPHDDTQAGAVFVAEWRTICETNEVTAAQSAAVLTKATGGASSKAAGVPSEMRADALHALQLFIETLGAAA